jgi:hypothetical protein
MKPLACFLSALLLASACASRQELCAGPAACRASDCVAGRCISKDATSPYVGTRRVVVRPADVAVLQRGAPTKGGELPEVFTLGAAREAAELLLRFDLRLDKSATIVRASVLLDRSDAMMSDPFPVAVHADRVIGSWSPQTVSWSTAPPVQDVRLPRTVIASTSPSLVRVDVTDLVRLWLAHDPGTRSRDNQGVLIVSENETRTGVTFALGSTSLPDLQDIAAAEPGSPAPPRLEIYLR